MTAGSTRDPRRGRLRRRTASVGGVVGGACLLTLLSWLLVPLAMVVDVVTLKRRLPVTRLVLFAWWWTIAETGGLVVSGWLFVQGRSNDATAHYRLMGNWANWLMRGLRVCLGATIDVTGADALDGGGAVVLSRHVSLADSLLSAWAITQCGVQPRYVLKRELLADPCLDVVGLRLPNHFLDRSAADGGEELAAIGALTRGVDSGSGTVVVIFPEGTRANSAKRKRAVAKIRETSPERAARLESLTVLLPIRPAGTNALLDAAPGVDVVFARHTGLDGMDTFSGMWRRLASGVGPIELSFERVAGSEVPVGDGRLAWLDQRWLEMDAEVSKRLQQRR